MPLPELKGIEALKQVEARLLEICRGDDSQTPLFSAVLQGGKRLRPALVVLFGSFAPAPRDELVDVATATELIHTASLIHDDVIDQAGTRRGIPTVSARFGTHQAVLYGDFLFARAFGLLTQHSQNGILANMTRAISLMCEGEIEQAALRFDCSLSEAAYMAYVHKKTAFFLSSCCLAGAEVCGLSPVYQRNVTAFGLQLGYAFQLTDDLLDFCGTSEATGKPVLHDLSEGYLTLPVIRLLRTNSHGPLVRRIIEERNFTAENLEYVRKALEATGILDDVRRKARLLILRAKQNLARLPATAERSLLARLADRILHRRH
jgi:geranylgeranyl pyrophosphate synthase